ncbi:MAG: hypothetical protein ACLP1X_16475 [Polyangiaceae bacterium]
MRDRLKLTVRAAVVAGALPALTVFAGEPHRTIDVSRVLDAGLLVAPSSDMVVTSTPADPEPLVERHQWVFDLRWDRGDVFLVGVRPLDLAAPQATPRVMGRFALELFEGAALFERVRFDFPLLGALDPGDGGWSSPPSLTQKLRTRIGVVFPSTRRGTRLELVDRATNRRWSVPWPPDESLDAGALSRPRDASAAR